MYIINNNKNRRLAQLRDLLRAAGHRLEDLLEVCVCVSLLFIITRIYMCIYIYIYIYILLALLILLLLEDLLDVLLADLVVERHVEGLNNNNTNTNDSK